MSNTLIVIDESTEFTTPQLKRLAFDIAGKELSVLQIMKIKNVLNEIDVCDKQGKPTGFKTNG